MIHRPKGEPPKLKVSQLEDDVIYWLCPDKSCNIFFDDKYAYSPCSHHCPHIADLVTIVKCLTCKDMVELPGNYGLPWQRVDHMCKKYNGTTAVGSSFISGTKYALIYDRPTKD
jgi:hypothetical protein